MDPETLKELAKPFPADMINWKPQAIAKGKGRAMAVPYIDARDVAERLDQVVGAGGWQVDHKAVGDQTLTGIAIKIEGEWIWKWDLGMIAQDADEAKSAKGSLSDGLKRAAVLWGIGRYLYRLPKTWCGYDEEKKRLTETPALPKWALPEGAKPQAPTSEAAAEPEAQKPANGNGKATSTTYWTLIKGLAKRHPPILTEEDGRNILAECHGDPELATQKVREQYVHDPRD